MKRTINKLLSVLLSTLIIFESVGINTTVYAENVANLSFKINGALVSNGSSYAYGDLLTFSVDGTDETPDFSYETEYDYINENDDWQSITSGQLSLEPGVYYFMYGVTVNDYYNYEYFRVNVTKGQLSAPTNLSWDNSKMTWGAVTTTTGGGTLDSDAVTNYTIDVYKNGSFITSYTSNSNRYDNFANNIFAEYGSGAYSFTVKANTSSDSAHYVSSAVSSSSGSYTAPNVSIANDTGSTVSSSSAFVLIPGNPDRNSQAISVNVKPNYVFVGWQAQPGVSGVQFANPASTSTTVTLTNEYNGGSDLTVYALTRDTALPSITSYYADVQNGKLLAAATDSETGIYAYAFSTATSEDSVTWTNVNNRDAGSIIFEYDLNEGGDYYLYIKDGSDNVVRSENAITISKIEMVDYYKTNSGNKTIYIEGNSYVLPTLSETAYNFMGWYADTGYSQQISTVSGSRRVYALWENQQIDADTISITGYSGGEFDESNHALSLPAGQVTGYEIQWYKNKTLINGANDTTYNVCHVADSGSYTAKITLRDDAGNVVDEITTDAYTVTIQPRDLTVSVAEKVIKYGDAAPESGDYTPVYDVGLSTPVTSITVGSFACDYSKGDNVDDYTIIPSGFTSDDYNISYANGTLKVEQRDLNEDNITVSITGTAVYTGNAVQPAFTITDANFTGDDALLESETDFIYIFSDNVIASTDTATLKITGYGNYKGEVIKKFDIARADYTAEVIMDNFMYGNTPSKPIISNNAAGLSDTEIRYYYRLHSEDGLNTYSETVPVNAGVYDVYAVLHSTDNYNEVTTPVTTYTIAKRNITITANSDWFEYDGNAHYNNGYSLTGDGFATGEGFNKVIVSGSVTNVNEPANNNTVEYELTSSTNPDNYNITVEPGTLSVTPLTLTYPSNIAWSSLNPGTVSWVPVSKAGLTVKYDIDLYAYDGEKYDLVDCVETTNSSYDFAQTIKEHALDAAKENKAYSYCVKIKTVPATSGSNYIESEYSEYTGNLLTAVVSRVITNHVTSLTIDGEVKTAILQGERVPVSFSIESGYLYNSLVTTEGLTSGFANFTKYVSIADDTTSSIYNGEIYIETDDEFPSVTSFTATNITGADGIDDYSGVKLSFTLHDIVGLAGYMISNSPYEPSADDSRWNAINGSYYSGEETVYAAGSYYIYVKDTEGNVQSYLSLVGEYLVNTPINVYALTLNLNSPDTRALYKAQNTSITIPTVEDLAYTNTGYAFQNWIGTTGIYEDGGKYSEDTNDTLNAYWTDQKFDYTVNYFYMDSEGQYPDTPETKTFNVLYGTSISSTTPSIQDVRKGFTLDDSADKQSTVTITEDGMSINVYYARNKYTLTYHYTLPGDGSETTVTNEYYYAADLSEAFDNKPNQPGYDFVGWTFDTTGSQPETMPNYNVDVSGQFVAKQTNYVVKLYTVNMANDGVTLGDTYSTVAASQENISSYHGNEVPVEDLIEEIKGFTFDRAFVTYENAAGSSMPAGESLGVGDSFTVNGAKTTYINLYYTREKYSITLNVWQGAVGTENKYTYTFNDIYYGQSIDPAYYSGYDSANWPHDLNYELADNVSWSTNSIPSVMPAGNVTVNRQFILKQSGIFDVEVWVETTTEGVYEKNTFSYYDNVGGVVTVGEGDQYTVDYSGFKYSISYLEYYDYRTVTDEEIANGIISGSGLNGATVTSTTVTNTNEGEDRAVLRVFFERQNRTTQIVYHMIKEGTSGQTDQIFAVAEKSRKWGVGNTYNYELTAFFDESTGGNFSSDFNTETDRVTSIVAVNGELADAYNFKDNNYVISYTAYYIMQYNTDRWITGQLSTEESLNADYNGPIGYNNYVHVYYTEVNPDNHVDIKVQFQESGLTGSDQIHPLYYDIDNGDETSARYYVYLANEAKFYDDARFVPDNLDSRYPGIAYLNKNRNTNGHYEYTKSAEHLKEEYSTIVINGTTYYLSKSEGRIYVADSTNRFYFGNYTYYTYENELSYSQVTDFLTDYQTNNADDAQAQGAYVYNRSFGSKVVMNGNSLTITYRKGTTYRLYYRLGGAICQSHIYASDSTVTSFNCGHNVFVNRPGYHIVWYTDSECTTVAQSILMDGDKTVYGQYEKNTVLYTVSAYYELPEAATVNGTTYTYVKESDIESLVSGGYVTVSYFDEYGQETDATTNDYKWYFNGILAGSHETKSVESFSYIQMDPANYMVTGLSYDDSYADNKISTNIEYEADSLAAYYRRDKYTLTVITSVASDSPAQQIEHTASSIYNTGVNVSIENPSRSGYTFTGWSWEKYDSLNNNWVEWSDHPSSAADYVQPAFDVQVTALFDDASFNQKVLHFYQNLNQSYDTDEVKLMIAMDEADDPGIVRDVQIVYDGITYYGKVFPNGGVSASRLEDNNVTKTYYSVNSTLVDGVYYVQIEDLSAVVITVTPTQNTSTTLNTYVNKLTHYSFESASSVYDNVITDYTSLTDSVTFRYGMDLEYYYAVEGGYKVELSAFDLKGTAVSSVLVGAGNDYHYGENVNITASTPVGYVFLGFYNKSDVINDDGNWVNELGDATPVSAASAYQFRIYHNYIDDEDANNSLVAVFEAEPVTEPILTTEGIVSLTYGYKSSSETVVTARASFPEGSATTSYVDSYAWYYVDDEGNKSYAGDSPTYAVPEGLEAGTYKLVCVVTVKHRNNGLSKTFETPVHTITVGVKNITASLEDYEGIYDGNYHTFNLGINGPDSTEYTVYYSDQPFIDGYEYHEGDNVTTTKPEYKDVNVDTNGDRCPHEVYFYVKSLNPNFSDYNCTSYDENNNISASVPGVVNITPKPATLSPGIAAYHKVYDGKAEVEGDDKMAFVTSNTEGNNVYNIVGLVSGDTGKTYIIDCDASFNSKHTNEANSFTVSNIVLVHKINHETTEIDYNYIFAHDYTITLSGYITKRPIELEWSDLEFTYDAQAHFPSASIDSDLPADDLGKLSVQVTGAQTSAGTYPAIAQVVSNDSDTYVTDYSISNSSAEFVIKKRPTTVVPTTTATYPYNGRDHTIETFEASNLCDSHSFAASPDYSYAQAGQYNIYPGTVRIIDTVTNNDVTDNYAITRESKEMIITAKTVKVIGITVNNKPYDGNTNATLNFNNIDFDGLLAGDNISLDTSKITGVFDNENAGENKFVTLSISDIEHALTGNDASSYTLVFEPANYDVRADITKVVLTATASNAQLTYGQNADSDTFKVTYTGFVNGENESVVSGDVTYTVGTSANSTSAYSSLLGAGNYVIVPDVSALSADNYTFTAANGQLTINPRPVKVVGEGKITKQYDANTDVTVNADNYTFTAVDGVVESGVVYGDSLSLSNISGTYDYPISGTYDYPNAAGDNAASKVTASNYTLSNSNYVLDNNTFDIDGSISKVGLTVSVQNKETVYGSPAPEFTVLYSGFKGDDNKNSLGGTLSFTCGYNIDEPANRYVGDYPVSASGYTSDNYIVSYNAGNLKVNRAVVTITATAFDSTIVDGSGIINVMYGSAPIPDMTYTHSPLKYNENWADIITGGTVTYLYPATLTETTVTDPDTHVTSSVINSPAGDYTIKPVISLTAQNYEFKGADATLRVAKYPLTISGVIINSKVYDGTRNVLPSQFDYSNVTYDGLLLVDKDYFINNPDTEKIAATGTYSDKNAGTGIHIDMSIQLSDYLKARCYTANGSQVSSEADIIARPLNVTAQDKTVKYGLPAPVFTVAYETNSADRGLVNGESFTNSNVTYSCAYQASSPFTEVGIYENYIHVQDLTDNGTTLASNYSPTYIFGKLTVEKNQFGPVQNIKFTNTPGTVTWDALADIGDVSVYSYDVVLCKDRGEIAGSERNIPASNSLEVDYKELIRGNGEGYYTVKVKAKASLNNNENHKNVDDGTYGVSSIGIYAAKVSFVYANDTYSQNGKGTSTITADELNSYVVLSGEQNIDIKAVFANNTGYTVNSVTSSSAKLSLGTGTFDDADTYTNTVSMAADLNSAADITVTIKLDARPATINVIVEPVKGVDTQAQVTYGYSVGPTITATSSVTADDNISTDGYIYEYKWYMYRGRGNSANNGNVVQQTALKDPSDPATYTGNNNVDSWVFPTGEKANTEITFYGVRCIVTATRLDNGRKTSTATNWNVNNSNFTNVTVNRATFTAKAAMFKGSQTSTSSGWMYGEQRDTAKIYDLQGLVGLSNNPSWDEMTAAHPSINTPKFTYISVDEYNSSTNPIWSEDIPTDVGTYYVKAFIKDSENYNEFNAWQSEYTFSITKNKLNNPENLGMGVSGTASYGTISWNDVLDIYENNNTNNAHPGVTYLVKLYKMSESDYELVKTYPVQSGTSLDITADLQYENVYKFSVQALSGDAVNVDHSDEVFSDPFNQGAYITVNGNGTLDGSTYTMKYDGTNMVLTANYNGSGTVSDYQWYKGSTPVSGADSSTLNIKNVFESGNYTCVLTVDGESVYTPIMTVDITKRSVTLTSASDSKVYDGTPLTRNEDSDITVGIDGFATGEGLNYSITGTITNYAENAANNNTFTYTYKDNTIANNYTIAVPVFGTLTITQRPLTSSGISITDMDPETYSKSQKKPDPAVTDTGLLSGTATLAKGSDFTYSYSNNVNAGTATVTVAANPDGNYSGTISKDFIINPKTVSLVWTNPDLTYNAQTQTGSTATVSNLETGDTCTVTVSGNTGVNAGDYTSKAESLSNTNYRLPDEVQTHDWTIKQKPVTVTADSDSKVYDGQPLTLDTASVTVGSLIEGHGLDVVTSGSITNVGEETNTLVSVKVYDGNNVDVTDNYDITLANGLLKVTERSINDANIDVDFVDSVDSVIYDALTHQPVTKITDNNLTPASEIVIDTDYTVTIKKNDSETEAKDAGTYSVTIKGIGNYKDEVTKTFVINQREAELYWTDPSLVYNGVEQTGSTATVTNIQGSDTCTVTVSGHTGINAGDYTSVAESLSNPNHKLPANKTHNWTIEQREITYANNEFDVSVSGTFVYSGSAHTPVPVVTDKGLAAGVGDKQLTDADFEYSYADNINAGTATITITGKGNYKSSVTKNFTIAKAENPMTVENQTWITGFATSAQTNANINKASNAEGDVTYSISSQTPGSYFTLSDNGSKLSLTAQASTPAGTYTVTIKVSTDGTNNYKSKESEFTVTVTVGKKKVAVPVLGDDLTFNGQTQEISVTGYDSGLMNQTGTTGKNVNTYTVTWSLLEPDNYVWSTGTSEDQTADWHIVKADGQVVPPAANDLTYNTEDQTLILEGHYYHPGTIDVAGTMYYSMSATGPWSLELPKATNAGTYTVYYYAEGDNNHNDSAVGSVDVEIKKADNEWISGPSIDGWIYGENKHNPVVSSKYGNDTIQITYVDADNNSSTSLPDNAGTYTVIFYVPGTENYNELSKTKTLKIDKRPILLISADGEKIYDGTPLVRNTADDITVDDMGFAGTDSFTYNITGTITNYAENADNNNIFTYDAASGTLLSNYDVSTVFGTLVITQRDLSDPDIIFAVIPVGSEIFNNEYHTPVPVVTDTGLATGVDKVLVENADFTYSYDNNYAVGDEAKVIITAVAGGNYKGTNETTFSIVYEENDAVGILSGDMIDASGGWYTSNTKISAPEGYLISTDGETWTESIPVTKDGVNNVNYFLKNTTTGNVCHPEKMNVKYDSTNPTITSLSGKSDTNSVTINVSCYDAASGVKSVEVLGAPSGAKITISEGKIVIKGLAEGKTYTFTIKVTDYAGRTTEQSIKFTTDVTPIVPNTDNNDPGKDPQNNTDPVNPDPGKDPTPGPDPGKDPTPGPAPEKTKTWALVNLIIVGISLIYDILRIRKLKKKFNVFNVLFTLGLGILFYFTENWHNKMVLIDKWTLVMAVIGILQLIVAYFGKKEEEEEEEEAQAAE